MPGLSCSALARQIGVSRQGVHQAVKRGVLRRGAEGLIDPSIEPNKSWIGLHAQGFDWRGRDMRSYARATRTNPQSVPPKVGETVELDIHDEAALDKFLKEGLAEFERTRMTDAELNAPFDEITADQSAREDRIVNELRQMVDG